MIDDNHFLTLTALSKGLSTLERAYDVTSFFIAGATEQGNDTDKEHDEFTRLRIELEFLSSSIIPKLQRLESLQDEIMFKFYPKLSREVDKELYQNRNFSSPPLPVGFLVDDAAASQRLSEEFKKYFKPSNQEWANKLSDFLEANQFVQGECKKALTMLLKLEPITLNERILWIDKSKRGPALKTISRLITYLIDAKHPQKHVKKKYDILITHYFKTPTGEFNPASLEVVISNMLNEEIETGGKRENIIRDFVLKLTTES